MEAVLHKKNIENLLESFGLEQSALEEILKKRQDLIRPEELYNTLVDKKLEGFTPDNTIKAIKQLFDSSVIIYGGSGDYGKKVGRRIIYGIAELQASLNEDIPVAIVELDIANMGGANGAIGRKNVDIAIKIITKIYQHHLEEDGASVIPVRSGGDEFRIITSRLSDNDIEKSLKKAQSEIEKFTKSMKITALRHQKYNDEDHLSGFSAGAGHVMLGDGKNEKEVQIELDEKIALSKKINGLIRAFNREHADSVSDHSSEASEFYTDKIKGNTEKILKKWSKKLDLHTVTVKEWPEDIFPVESEYKKNPYRNPEEVRKGAVDKYIAENNVTEPIANLLNAGLEAYDSRSPLTGMKVARDLHDDMSRFKKGNDKNILTEIELLGLSGVNQVGLDAGNTLIKNVAKILKNTLIDEFDNDTGDFLYTNAGGKFKFRLLTHGIEHEDIQRAIGIASDTINKEINSQEINGRAVGDIVHPKHKKMHGIGLSAFTIELNPQKSVGVHLGLAEGIGELLIDKELRGDKFLEALKKADQREISEKWTCKIHHEQLKHEDMIVNDITSSKFTDINRRESQRRGGRSR